MRASGHSDCLIVVNGPEDGVEFPIVRAPMHIGNDPLCAAHLSLDSGVRPLHALVTAVSDGYRVRRVGTGTVYADGKPAGMLRSRIVRTGGTVQVGETVLVLECAVDGLARRSRGLVTESDFGWAVQRVLHAGTRSVTGLVRFVGRMAGRILSSWLAIAAVLFLVYAFVPGARAWVNWVLGSAYSFVYYRVIAPLMSQGAG
jgi:hypothetical protein